MRARYCNSWRSWFLNITRLSILTVTISAQLANRTAAAIIIKAITHHAAGPRPPSAAPSRSTRVVYAALAGNVLVAASKFVAAAISGSSAMLTEAIHSSADCLNQVLLLVGNKRSHTPPDASHAFGYGLEIYFWTFVVAIMVLLAGGGVSIYTGVHRLTSPEPIVSPRLSLIVLALSAVFEAVSFGFGYREYRRMIVTHVIPGERVGLWLFIKRSKDPNAYETLLEDGAALVGLAIAAFGIVASAYGGLLWADGVASIAIGLLLVFTSFIIAAATRSLIAGESAAAPLRADLRRRLEGGGFGLEVADIATLHLGPEQILVALTCSAGSDGTAADVRASMDRLTAAVQAVDPRITRVLFRLS